MPHGGISPIATGKEGSAPPPRELLKKLDKLLTKPI